MSSKPNSKKPCIENNPKPELNKETPLPSHAKENIKPPVCNPFTDIKKANLKIDFKNQTQLIPNSTDKNPNGIKNSQEMKNGVIKIKLFKSTIKPFRSMNPEQNNQSANLELLKKKTANKNEEIDKSPLVLEQAIDKKAQYKMLIKKIAMQLKKKIRPRTKGFFYKNVFRNEKYLTLVKKIALSIKNKIGIHPPTNGVFHSYMEKEEKIITEKEEKIITENEEKSIMEKEEEIKKKKDKQEKYKMLIKKISSQLKKRVKLPSCKIIKIYESYRALIKRIADALKKSMKSQNKVNSSSSENNIITENVEENVEENKEENKDNMAMDIEMEDKTDTASSPLINKGIKLK